ncbi:MAG: tetratricopeptide repeat protein [Caulobacteraceae bacterium]
MRRALFSASILAALLLPFGALAMGGGGGAMSGSPSMTTPAYDPTVEFQSGQAALKAGKYKDAANHFERVTEVDASEPNTWLLLGVARSGAGEKGGAVRAFEHAVKLAPDNVLARQELGLAYAVDGKNDKAHTVLADLQAKSTACAGECPDADALKAAVAAVQQSLAAPAGAAPSPSAGAAAAQPPGPGASLGPSQSLLFASAAGDAAYSEAVGLINARRYAEAKASLLASERAFGPHPDILTYLGYVERKEGDRAGAARYYAEALAIAPTHRGALEYFGELKVLDGDMTGARDLLTRLEEACPYGCAESDALQRWIAARGDPDPDGPH